MTTDTLQSIMATLTKDCDALSATALRSLDLVQAAKLAVGTRPYVVIRTTPLLQATVLAEADDGESMEIWQGKGIDLPATLGPTVAAFVTDQLARLPPHNQQNVVADVHTGAATLAVIVWAFPFSVDLMLFVGTNEAHLLAQVTAGDERVH